MGLIPPSPYSLSTHLTHKYTLDAKIFLPWLLADQRDIRNVFYDTSLYRFTSSLSGMVRKDVNMYVAFTIG